MGLRSSLEIVRTMRMSSAFCSWVPWEKLRRATSRPARTSCRKISGVLDAGPRVATILARRGALQCGKGGNIGHRVRGDLHGSGWELSHHRGIWMV